MAEGLCLNLDPISQMRGGFFIGCDMQKDRCQANTKKNKPCKNYAIQGSNFCHIHRIYDDFAPVQITAATCPYCQEPLSKNAESCDFCKESFLICPYCDEPLKRDAKSCSFCKFDRTPIQPIHHDLNAFTPVHTSSPPEGASLTLRILFFVHLVLLIGFLYFVVTYLFSF